MTSLLLDTDSYKASHYLQLPPGLTHIHSYIESRGGEFDSTVFFGLQYILKKYLSCSQPQEYIDPDEVEFAKEIFEAHGLPFNYEGWMYIVKDLKGRLPLRIRAVPEGTIVLTHNVLLTIENTDPRVPWLTNWVETALMRLWYPTTVATISHEAKKIIWEYLKLTADDPKSEIDFKLHDFGSRGVSSQESAGIGGAAHLVNFMGTDTVQALLTVRRYYQEVMAGFSIPAAEHMTITSWGRENEAKAYDNMLTQFAKPGKLVAVVSDSYDIYNACEKIWGSELRQKVIDSGATVVIRPDSGTPSVVVRKVCEILAEKFGYSTNRKGYKVLNNVRIIQGDGVDLASIPEVLSNLVAGGFSASNVAFGMGGALLQKCNRDTMSFAMKASAVKINGEWRGISKDPVTGSEKRSKAGRLDLVNTPTGFVTEVLGPFDPFDDSALETVFENGKVLNNPKFSEIRERANREFV